MKVLGIDHLWSIVVMIAVRFLNDKETKMGRLEEVVASGACLLES